MLAIATHTELFPWKVCDSYNTSNRSYKIYASDFWWLWPEVRLILWPLHYKWIRKNWKKPLLDENHSKHSNISLQVDLTVDTLNRKIVIINPFSWPQGHFRSWKITSSFSAITFDRDKLERWKYNRCVQADDMHQSICDITFSGQVMNHDLDLWYFFFFINLVRMYEWTEWQSQSPR